MVVYYVLAFDNLVSMQRQWCCYCCSMAWTKCFMRIKCWFVRSKVPSTGKWTIIINKWLIICFNTSIQPQVFIRKTLCRHSRHSSFLTFFLRKHQNYIRSCIFIYFYWTVDMEEELKNCWLPDRLNFKPMDLVVKNQFIAVWCATVEKYYFLIHFPT